MRTLLTIGLVLASTSAYACDWNKSVKLEQSVATLETKVDEKVEEAVTTSDAKLVEEKKDKSIND